MAKKKSSAKKSQKKTSSKKSQKKSASKKSSAKKSASKKSTTKKSTTKSITKKSASAGKPSDSKPEKKSNGFWLASLAVIGLVAIILVALIMSGTFMKKAPSDQVVLVNGEAIFASEIQQVYSQLPPEVASQYTAQDVVDQLVTLELVLQYADSRGVSASDEQVETYIDELVAQAGGSRQLLDQQLAAANISQDDLREEVRQRVIVNNLQELILEETQVSVQEIQRAYADDLDSYQAGPGQVRIKHILVSDEELAQTLADRARAGEDFSELAMEFSEGPSSTAGGDLGFVDNTTSFVEPFKTVALELDQGEISDPVETQFGFHVIYRGDDTIELDEVRDEIENSLKTRKAQANFAQTLEDLRAEADIVYVVEPEEVI